MIAVVAGASGLVGAEILKLLLAEPRVDHVISVGRRALLADPKLDTVKISDLRELRARAEELAGDAYFCALGTTIKTAGSQENFRKVDFEGVVDFASVAKDHDAKAFTLISASGADPKSMIFYSRVKGEAERAVRDLGLRRVAIWQPSLLLGDRAEARPAEKRMIGLAKKISPWLPEGISKRLGTPVERLAQRAVREGLAVQGPSGVSVFAASQI